MVSFVRMIREKMKTMPRTHELFTCKKGVKLCGVKETPSYSERTEFQYQMTRNVSYKPPLIHYGMFSKSQCKYLLPSQKTLTSIGNSR